MSPKQIGEWFFMVGGVTGVTDWGSEFAVWWSGTASISLSVMLSWRWSLNTCCHSSGPLFTRPRLGLRMGSSRSAPSCLFGPLLLHHQLLSQLYKLPLFSLLFPPLQPWLWEHGKWGRHAKRCGIFFIVLGTHSKPSQGTLAFSSCLPYSPSLPSASIPIWKAQVFSRPVSFLRSSHICPVFK